METRVRDEKAKGNNETSLLFSSDFCDFEDFGLSTHPERFVIAGQLVGGVWWAIIGTLLVCLQFARK